MVVAINLIALLRQTGKNCGPFVALYFRRFHQTETFRRYADGLINFLFLPECAMNSIDEEMMRRIRHDLIDSYDEELEMELEDRTVAQLTG